MSASVHECVCFVDACVSVRVCAHVIMFVSLQTIYRTGSVSLLLIAVENMSHCGHFLVEIHFSTFLLLKKKAKKKQEKKLIPHVPGV